MKEGFTDAGFELSFPLVLRSKYCSYTWDRQAVCLSCVKWEENYYERGGGKSKSSKYCYGQCVGRCWASRFPYNFLCLLLLLNRFSHVWLCATPQTAAHQAPPSLGFSRQEHWSGLPFPSPMHESEKWKWSCSVVSDSVWPHGLQPTRLLRPWDFPGKSTGVGCHCLLLSMPRYPEIQEPQFKDCYSWSLEQIPAQTQGHDG